MDENTWRFAQLMMWLIGIQTTAIMAAFGGIWLAMNKRFDGVENRFDGIEKRIEKLDEKVTDIDRRVCRIEGSLNSKECCMLKDSRTKEKID